MPFIVYLCLFSFSLFCAIDTHFWHVQLIPENSFNISSIYKLTKFSNFLIIRLLMINGETVIHSDSKTKIKEISNMDRQAK